MSKKICLGKIAAAHGVKGLVKILPYGEDPALITELGKAYTSKDAATPTLAITLKNTMGKYILAEIDGCASRNDAEALRGTELFYNRDDLPEAEDGEFYYDDLVGLKILHNDETIGTLKAVQNFGASDLFEVQPTKGKSFFIPYADEFIDNIDLNAGTITANNIEGLQDE